MARTTVTNTIERIRRQLNSTVRLEVNVLAVALDASETVVTTTYDLANSIRNGAVLSIGSELMRVVAVSVSSKEITVIRGWQDTAGETHAIGDEILVNPRFTRFDIFDSMVNEIDSWAPDLFYVADATMDTVDDQAGVEVPSAFASALGVIEVRRNWTEDESVVWPTLPFVLHRGRSASLTPTEATGMFIRFTKDLGYARNGSIAVRFAMPYSTATLDESIDLADLEVTGGLLELIELGVKSRLLHDDEIGRTGRGMQDEPRRTEEVPAGAVMTLSQSFLQRYERRRNQEVRRLRTLHPFQAW